jgi:hypothetical protein
VNRSRYDHKRGPHRPEQSKGHQQTADGLSQGCDRREQAAWTEADCLKEPAGAVKTVAAEPAEKFLSTVSGHTETEEEPRYQQCHVHMAVRTHRAIGCLSSAQLSSCNPDAK